MEGRVMEEVRRALHRHPVRPGGGCHEIVMDFMGGNVMTFKVILYGILRGFLSMGK